MEKNIKCLSGDNPSNEIINPKMPFNFNNPNGTRIIAAIFCDGGITKKLNPFYVNFDNNLRSLVRSSFAKVFGKIQGKIEGKNQLIFPKIVGEILVYGLGLPYGRKIYFNPSLPEFIFNTNIDSKISFIKQAFDDEGSVSNKSIKFTSAGISEPPLFLKNIKKLMEIFKIKTTDIFSTGKYCVKSGEKHKQYCFYILGRANLIKFYRIINFNSRKKAEKLKAEIDSYKRWQVSPGEALDNALFNIRKLELENKTITTKNLMKKMGRSSSQVLWCIRQLVKTGFLKTIKESYFTMNGPTSREFRLTDKGRKKIKYANISEYE
ncbi:MAG: hypothetical protein QXL86_01225 [Candidatus Aenigmatarchaeota archaeon]